jgi:hypothetical protein
VHLAGVDLHVEAVEGPPGTTAPGPVRLAQALDLQYGSQPSPRFRRR